MNTVPSKLTRYIRASIDQFFASNLAPTTLYVEGAEINQTLPEYFELRLSGPDYNLLPSMSLQIELTINLAIVCQKSSNLYRIQDLIGVASKLFTTIPVLNYDDVDPPYVQLFCIDQVDKIKISDYGDMVIGKQPIRVNYAEIQASFLGEITNGSYQL